jgi:hypothetical protein
MYTKRRIKDSYQGKKEEECLRSNISLVYKNLISDWYGIHQNIWSLILGSSHFKTPYFRFLTEILRWVSFLTGSGFTYLGTTQN